MKYCVSFLRGDKLITYPSHVLVPDPAKCGKKKKL